MLLIDEASRVDVSMYRALHPMLAVGDGDLWMMSTPYGRRGFFWETWEFAGEEWEKVSVRAEECPRIGERFLKEQMEVRGPAWFAQEYGCSFVDDQSQMFSRELVERALDSHVKALFPGNTWEEWVYGPGAKER